MIKRKKHFLACTELSHDGELFDYIRELHRYLWRFTRVHVPDANDNLREVLDIAIEKAEKLRS